MLLSPHGKLYNINHICTYFREKRVDNHRESFHFDVEVDDVAHLVKEPSVNLGELVQQLVTVASFQCSRQHEHTLVGRIRQLLPRQQSTSPFNHRQHTFECHDLCVRNIPR